MAVPFGQPLFINTFSLEGTHLNIILILNKVRRVGLGDPARLTALSSFVPFFCLNSIVRLAGVTCIALVISIKNKYHGWAEAEHSPGHFEA